MGLLKNDVISFPTAPALHPYIPSAPCCMLLHQPPTCLLASAFIVTSGLCLTPFASLEMSFPSLCPYRVLGVLALADLCLPCPFSLTAIPLFLVLTLSLVLTESHSIGCPPALPSQLLGWTSPELPQPMPLFVTPLVSIISPYLHWAFSHWMVSCRGQGPCLSAHGHHCHHPRV